MPYKSNQFDKGNLQQVLPALIAGTLSLLDSLPGNNQEAVDALLARQASQRVARCVFSGRSGPITR